jgi:ATP-dependent exoDNAse (exonuclease V) beta subunit
MNNILKKLDSYNDPLFAFDPIKHKYTYQGETFISVTQYISKFHKPFDTEYWSKKKAVDGGVDQEVILAEWKQKNDRANFIGTSTHNWIENYYNKLYQDLPSDMDVIERINKFNIIYAKFLHKLTPIKFEQRVFSKKLKIAGMIDSIFMYDDKVVILDWKTNKKFTTNDSDYGMSENLLEPFNSYYKNHLTEYSIQVSLYSLILSEIGIDVRKCYLVHIGPEGDAVIHKAYDFQNILSTFLANDKN